MTDQEYDLELERQIWFWSERTVDSATRQEKIKAAHRVRELVAQRSSARVRQMEERMGLLS